jgi:hypothetical protein
VPKQFVRAVYQKDVQSATSDTTLKDAPGAKQPGRSRIL